MVRVSASSAKDLRQFKRQRSVRDENGKMQYNKEESIQKPNKEG